jgi:ubiquinone/menaquinone biosynthesis C-methylase UbiE
MGRFLKAGEYKPQKIGGRAYIPDSRYFLCTDEQEAKRLDEQHVALRKMLGRNYFAPLTKRKIRFVLDVGCGNGSWAIDASRRDFKRAGFFGFDLRETNLQPYQIPTNVILQRADLVTGIPYVSRSFDLVHQRFLCDGIAEDQWPTVFADYFRVLRSNGWIDIMEMNYSAQNAGPITERLFQIVRDIAGKKNVSYNVLERFESLIQGAGFVKVEADTKVCNLGSWSGSTSKRYFDCLCGKLQGIFPLAVQLGVAQQEELDTLMQGWEDECNQLKTYQLFYIYTAKKPSP